MAKVKLYYFNVRALGEGPRMLLAYGGQQFEDHRLDMEEWVKLKPKTPFGQVPVLELDGVMYGQSRAICRYLGHKFGLAGETLEDALEIDQNMDFYNDLLQEAYAIFREPDEELKAKLKAEAEKDEFPRMLKKFEEIVKKNNGHIALGKLTWGDFLIAGMHDNIKRILQMPDLYEKYPSLKRIYDNVVTVPKVKAFLDAAPKSEF